MQQFNAYSDFDDSNFGTEPGKRAMTQLEEEIECVVDLACDRDGIITPYTIARYIQQVGVNVSVAEVIQLVRARGRIVKG